MPISANFQSFLRKSYDCDAWQEFLQEIFPEGTLRLFATPQPLAATQENVNATRQLGTVELADGHAIALLEVETSDQVMLARNRVGLRNFVASFIDEAGAAAVLAVFHQKTSADWRLTYASRRTTLDEDTFEIATVETAPRRFTFLLGENEACRTAAARLAGIREKGESLSLADVENAFSVEALTKDFFNQYKEHYQAFVAHLLSPDQAEATRESFGVPKAGDEKEQERADKPVRDFVKTLLGRLVFLHFLQKKGWLGCEPGSRKWTGGDPDFLRSYLSLAKEKGDGDFFHSKYLCPLFFEALNTPDRPRDLFPLTGTRLPYLNGGLFEEDGEGQRAVDFPVELFGRLLDFFAEYNFTIDENDPEDHEVGIDPEMLGHIFENLLEDNKDKGAFYTPKAIVSYMARQSLLRYLQTHLGQNPELELLLNEKDHTRHPRGSFVAANAKRIAELLEEVKICDPAIGSGAFPIGLLHEILWTRLALNPELNTPEERAKLKRRIIQNSIHGVDIDPGAIEIARLRFWLALVVDEDEPRPLPNLDYKIHCADSLIETIRGEPVSPGTKTRFGVQIAKALDRLLDAKRALFSAQRLPEKRKAWLGLYRALAEVAQLEFTSIRNEKAGLLDDGGEKVAVMDRAIGEFGHWIEKIDSAKKLKVRHQDTLLGELRAWFDDPAKPTFLWSLHFGEIFARGGFDIVVANPPYVRHETISSIAPLLRERFEVAASRADLYIFFYEQSVKILREGGVLAFITSNKYFRAAYGKKLRPFLKRTLRIETLIDFGDAPVFDAIAYASILVGVKTSPPPKHTLRCYVWKPEDSVQRLPLVLGSGAFPLRQDKLGDTGWQLDTPEAIALLEKLRMSGTPLEKYVGGQFFYGIKTGLNEAFVISGEKRRELIEADPKSADLIKPFLRGKDVKRWKVSHQGLYLIVFPHGFHTKLKQYPAILRHLSSFEKKLKKRGQCTSSRGNKKGGQHHWIELDNNPKEDYLALHDSPKLVYPELAAEPRFAFDKEGFAADCTLYLVPTEDASLLAFLNNKTITWFIRKISAVNRGGYVRFKKQYMSGIPIPSASSQDKARLAELAGACAEAAKKNDARSLAVLEAEIDEIVCRLFGLTPEEIALIEGSAAADTAPAVTGRHGEPSKKEALFRRLRNLAEKAPYISFETIRHTARETWPDLKDDTLRHYLSEAASLGILRNAGRGYYSSIPQRAELPGEPVREIVALISGEFPLLDFKCWSTAHWNPWLRHLVANPVVFVSCELVSLPAVHDFLLRQGKDSRPNPTALEIAKNPLGEETIVLRPLFAETPPSHGPVASVEQVLVDARIENQAFRIFSPDELRRASLDWMRRQRVHFSAIIRYLRSRMARSEEALAELSIISK